MGELLPGPRPLPSKLSCAGCPALKTKWWKEYLDNDETDCGTHATCTLNDRSIGAYWSEKDAPPSWCPASPQPSAEAAQNAKDIDRLRHSRDFYARRCEALQAIQSKMRDPERKAVCDILANGETYAMSEPAPVPAGAVSAGGLSVPELLQAIVNTAAGWDKDGATVPKEPYEYETVWRISTDYAKAALAILASHPAQAVSVPETLARTMRVIEQIEDECYSGLRTQCGHVDVWKRFHELWKKLRTSIAAAPSPPQQEKE